MRRSISKKEELTGLNEGNFRKSNRTHPESLLQPKDAAAGVENNIKLRGGHAPGHVRDAFRAAIEAFYHWNDGEPEPTVTFEINYEPVEIPISKACGLVWNCTDILPGSDFTILE